jgi:hypothetical protein
MVPQVSEAHGYGMVLDGPVEAMPLYAPIAVLIQHAIGKPANTCVPLSYQLVGALRHLGYQAQLMVACASVVGRDGAGTKVTDVGVWERPPIVRPDGTTNGHVVVWADSFHRLVDLTIGQDATLQRAAVQDPDLAASSVVLPMPRLLSFMETGGRPIATLRGPFVINYMLFPEYLDALDPLFAEWRHNGILRAVDASALSLAHATLDILRMVERDRPDRRCSDPSIRALLDGHSTLPPLRR